MAAGDTYRRLSAQGYSHEAIMAYLRACGQEHGQPR
jgi:hypothetical protein